MQGRRDAGKACSARRDGAVLKIGVMHGLSDTEAAAQAASDDEAAALEEGGKQEGSLEIEPAETAAKPDSESSPARDQPAQERGYSSKSQRGWGMGGRRELAGGDSHFAVRAARWGASTRRLQHHWTQSDRQAQGAKGLEEPKGSCTAS